MKNILKTTVVLFSIFAISSANAGTLTVTGSAKASYSIISSDGAAGASEADKGIGISNEFTLGASGETENGIAWKYAIDMDGTGATAADDQQLVLTFPTLGTVGIYVSEGGIDVDNSWDKSVYARPSDTSFNELKRDGFSIGDVNNIQYHLPAGLLPFGITAKVGYAPGTTGTINDVNATGDANAGTTDSTTIAEAQSLATGFQSAASVSASSMTAYQVTAAPIDGLAIGASYETFGGSATGLAQSPESGSWYATYAMGPVSIGYGKTYVAYELTTVSNGATALESSENTNYSLGFAVNDDLSISYTKEKSKLVAPTSSTVTYELDATGIQAAYTMGGMTLSVAQNSFDNAKYTNNNDVTNTVFGIAMAF
jgi:hypothetical protein